MRAMIGLAVVTLALSLPAQAQFEEEPDYTLPRVMGDAFAGMGGGAFNQDLGHATNGGFAFNVRLGFDGTGPARWMGAEFAYQGLQTNTEGAVEENIYGGILGGNLRANLPIPIGNSLLRPYVLGGVGWSHIASSDDFSTTLGASRDDAVAVPLGGGVSFFFVNGFGLDGRFVYNIITGERTPNISSGDSWSVALNAGGRWGQGNP